MDRRPSGGARPCAFEKRSHPRHAFGVEDGLFALLELENGGLAQLSHGWTLPANSPIGLQAGFRLIATTGLVDVADTDSSLLSVSPGSLAFNDSFHWPTFGRDIGGDPRAEAQHFVEAVLTDEPFLVPIADAVSAVAVSDAILRSLKSGAPEPVSR